MNYKIFPFIFLCFFMIQCQTEKATVKIRINKKSYQFELASTPEQRRKGLMHRTELASDHGMLFVFPKERILNFWMKDTLLPLQIAYIDKDLTIFEIRRLRPLDTNTVQSSKPAKFALEVNEGFFLRNNIKTGDKIKIESKLPDVY